MLKWLAIFAIDALVAVSVCGQPNKNPEPAKQEQPVLHPAHGEERQSKHSAGQNKPDDNLPASDVSLERSRWWAKSDW